MDIKWANSNVKYYYDNYNSSRFKYYVSQGASAWNSTDADYTFGSLFNVYTTEVFEPDAAWDGLSVVNCSGNYFTSIIVKLNASATTTWNSNGALKSVAVHEMGHALGLNDLISYRYAVMNGYTWGSGSRYVYYEISYTTTDDRNGVNAIY